MNTTISSKKAADFLNVNESTIKRWADSGALKCHRTEGGHRKFLIEDLKKYASENNYLTSEMIYTGKNGEYRSDLTSRNFNSLARKLKKFILEGRSEKSYELLYTMLINGITLEDIFDKVTKEAMRMIGDEWQKKTLSIENEHIATNTLIASLHQLERIMERKSYNSKTALCAGLENDFHEIGLLCVKMALEAEGWKVIYPGINLPYRSVSELIKKNKPDLICISSTFIRDKKNYIRHAEELKKLSKKSGSFLVFGGENNLKKDISEFSCKSITELKNIINNNI